MLLVKTLTTVGLEPYGESILIVMPPILVSAFSSVCAPVCKYLLYVQLVINLNYVSSNVFDAHLF